MRSNSARLQAIQQLAVLDTAAERVYDDLVRLVARSLGVPIAAVNVLDAERDWFKACVGFPMSESPASTSFCEVFFQESSDLIVASDTTNDQRFRNHPLVRGEPFIRFYAAARLTVGHQTVGTMCVYDTTPHQVTASQLEDLQALANAAMHVLTARSGSGVNPPVSIGDSVVLLDDNAASASALSELITLSAPELTVASCTDWTSALPATLGGSPRAVIVDIKGSNAPSLASVHAIRSVMADAAPSFIALSADVLDLDALRWPGGFDHAFAKPLEFDALLAALKR